MGLGGMNKESTRKRGVSGSRSQKLLPYHRTQKGPCTRATFKLRKCLPATVISLNSAGMVLLRFRGALKFDLISH
jgi:hypothetical protein